jgi:hypothetical protein
MDGIAVARRCADLTEEIFEIAKISIQSQRKKNVHQSQRAISSHGEQGENMSLGGVPPYQDLNAEDRTTGVNAASNDQSSFELVNDTFFSSIMDVNFLDNFDANLSAMNFDGSPFETMDLNWNTSAR